MALPPPPHPPSSLPAGVVTLSSFISPYASDRDAVRARLSPGDFLEIYMKVGRCVCVRVCVCGGGGVLVFVCVCGGALAWGRHESEPGRSSRMIRFFIS